METDIATSTTASLLGTCTDGKKFVGIHHQAPFPLQLLRCGRPLPCCSTSRLGTIAERRNSFVSILPFWLGRRPRPSLAVLVPFAADGADGATAAAAKAKPTPRWGYWVQLT
eukprot:scaffold4197_cov199-Pinguiococcus_pyrenoidosus.AAC.3